MKKLELLKKIGDVMNKTRARRLKTIANIAAVAESVKVKAGLFISCCSLEFGIPQKSLNLISHIDI